MAYFPFFMDIESKPALIVGGGKIALRKIEKLLPFNPDITVISPVVSDEILALENIRILTREYEDGDEKSYSFAIAATDDRKTNRKISENCKVSGIPVNVVDDPELCTFLFPALVKNGKLTVGITTTGSSPTAAIEIRKSIEDMLPDSLDEILDYLYRTREEIRKTVSTEKERHVILKKLYKEALRQKRALTTDETERIIHPEGKKGFVYIVGAGCGKKDLITIKGLEAIKASDVIVYDDLIDNELLNINNDARLIYMGKRSGHHSARQEEINEALIRLGNDGLIITRLKGGDPFVFGRGGEEALALKSAGIPFEVVNGITSAIAVPAEAGIPVTHRGVSRGFMVVTGHTRDDEELDEILSSISTFPGTSVILIGLSRLELITETLLKKGMDENTPAAVVSGGNSPAPETVRGTLGTISGKTRENNVESPAVIVIGKTAGMDTGKLA